MHVLNIIEQFLEFVETAQAHGLWLSTILVVCGHHGDVLERRGVVACGVVDLLSSSSSAKN